MTTTLSHEPNSESSRSCSISLADPRGPEGTQAIKIFLVSSFLFFYSILKINLSIFSIIGNLFSYWRQKLLALGLDKAQANWRIQGARRTSDSQYFSGALNPFFVFFTLFFKINLSIFSIIGFLVTSPPLQDFALDPPL